MSQFFISLSVSIGLFVIVTGLWTGIMKSHEELVKNLYILGFIKREGVVDLMNKFDRYDFLPHAPEESWQNMPICINYTAEMPEASYHGQSLDAIYKHLKPGAKCLDIGSGTGYITACMAEMVGPTGKVYGIEHIPYILERSIEAIRINHEHLLDDGTIEFVCKDGRGGLHEKGPFDVIHIGGSIVKNPYHLMSQLKQNGCLIAPIGLNHCEQTLRRFIKYNDTTLKMDDLVGTIQHPLMPREEQERQWNETLADFDRSWNKLLETLKYKEYKSEKERNKTLEEAFAKMSKRTVAPLNAPPKGLDDEQKRYINDLSAMFEQDEPESLLNISTTRHSFDFNNYGQLKS